MEFLATWNLKIRFKDLTVADHEDIKTPDDSIALPSQLHMSGDQSMLDDMTLEEVLPRELVDFGAEHEVLEVGQGLDLAVVEDSVSRAQREVVQDSLLASQEAELEKNLVSEIISDIISVVPGHRHQSESSSVSSSVAPSSASRRVRNPLPTTPSRATTGIPALGQRGSSRVSGLPSRSPLAQYNRQSSKLPGSVPSSSKLPSCHSSLGKVRPLFLC